MGVWIIGMRGGQILSEGSGHTFTLRMPDFSDSLLCQAERLHEGVSREWGWSARARGSPGGVGREGRVSSRRRKARALHGSFAKIHFRKAHFLA